MVSIFMRARSALMMAVGVSGAHIWGIDRVGPRSRRFGAAVPTQITPPLGSGLVVML